MFSLGVPFQAPTLPASTAITIMLGSRERDGGLVAVFKTWKLRACCNGLSRSRDGYSVLSGDRGTAGLQAT